MTARVEYDAFAEIYDAWVGFAPITAANKRLYVDELAAARGPCVELGVGNGRITVEVAAKGKAITGVDSSTEMLELCRRRAAEAGVEDRVQLIHADFRDFQLDGPAELITIPFHSIGHLLTDEDKLACMRHVRDQLAPGGRFVFDHFVADLSIAERTGDLPMLRGSYVDEATGNETLLWSISSYDTSAQTIELRACTEELDGDGVVLRKKYRTGHLSWFAPEKVRRLLEEAGLRIETCYGDFDRTPFGDDSRMQIWVAVRD